MAIRNSQRPQKNIPSVGRVAISIGAGRVLKWFAVAAATCMLLTGCGASGQQFNAGALKPAPGRALVYVYRPSTIVGIGNADVPFLHLNGRRLTRIRIGGYFATSISPGSHKITTTESLLGNDTGKIRGAATFTAKPNSTVYLRYTEGFSSMVPIVAPKGALLLSTGYFRFESVPKDEALAELADTQGLGSE